MEAATMKSHARRTDPRLETRDALRLAWVMRRDGMEHALMDLFRRRGDIGVTRVGNRTVVLVADPSQVFRVLGKERQCFIKGSSYNEVRRFLGDGLITSEGDAWRAQRRVLQPFFHKQAIRDWTPTMRDVAHEASAGWADDEVVDISEAMSWSAAEVLSRTLIGLPFDQLGELPQMSAAEALAVSVGFVGDRSAAALRLPMWLPTPDHRRFRVAMRTLDTVLARMLDEARAGRAEPDSMIHALLDTGAPDEVLREQLLNIFFAGQETTGVTLAATLYELARHPRLQADALAEILDVVGGDSNASLEHAHIPKLGRMKRFVEETLRLHPVVWTIARTATEDCELGGVHVPRGAMVLVAPYVTHRHPRVWRDAERFDPERFTKARTAERERYAYLPFSLGQRTCIGNHMSLHESVVVAAALLRRFRFELTPESRMDLHARGVLRPKAPMRVRVIRRG